MLLAGMTMLGAGTWLLPSPDSWSSGVHPLVGLVSASAALIGWQVGNQQRRRLPPSEKTPGVCTAHEVPPAPIAEHSMALPLGLGDLALSHAGAAMVISDALDRVVYANPAFAVLTGMSPARALGQPAELMGMQPLRPSHLPGLDSMLRQGQCWSGEGTLDDVHGQFLDVWLSVSVIRNAEGHITHHVRTFQDVAPLKQQLRQMAEQARHDSLTGLANRRAFDELMFQAMARTRRYTKTLAVMCVDLDGFKRVNDVHGHQVGDQLLVAVARRLEGCVRTTDRVCRMGGDEFMLILEGPGQWHEIRRIGERILQGLHEPFTLGDAEVLISSSVGVAVYDGQEDEISLIKRADEAMYAAKQAGKNQMVFVESEMSADRGNRPWVISRRA
jgi:diguanylate cyclase (GGDEF)-like protein/PAS domain S-box-containing protein